MRIFSFLSRFLALLVVALFVGIAIVRTDFSLARVALVGCVSQGDCVSSPLDARLFQKFYAPFHYLSRGRQAYVFASDDGEIVLKLFDRRYIETPWYVRFLFTRAREREQRKRQLRREVFARGYFFAAQHLSEETGIVGVHFHKTEALPKAQLIDSASRRFVLDLNDAIFILQRRGKSLYPHLHGGNLAGVLRDFFSLVAKRIALRLADADHDVEYNFGLSDGEGVCRLMYLDPGRLFVCPELAEPERQALEWWRATHRLRAWLEQRHPAFLPLFDEEMSRAVP